MTRRGSVGRGGAASTAGDRASSRTPDLVLKAAARLFRTQGFDATTTRQLARAIGLERSSLYHHIAGKESLLYEIAVSSITTISDRVTAAVEAEDTPLSRVRALIIAHVTTLLSDPSTHATALGELRSLRGDRRKHVLALRDTYDARVRTLIEAARSAGVLGSKIESKYLALALLNLMNYCVIWYNPRRAGLSAVQVAEILAEVYLAGVVRADGATVRLSAT